LFAVRKMKETDRKRKEAEFMRQHTLNEKELKKLISEKIARARAYHIALGKREALFAESR
jgi:hypothetical protein